MQILEKNKDVIIKGVSDFNPKHIFECGQCFRWDLQDDGSYTGVAFEKVINVSMDKDDIVIKNSNLNDVRDIWVDYLDLKKDYTAIKNSLCKMDKYLEESTKYGYGIRILSQDFHEMVISFIISARNSIPMIKKSVEKLSQDLGRKIGSYNGKDYYSFPSMEALANSDLEVITNAKVAFRAKYIKSTAQMILKDKITYKDFESLDLEQTNLKLQEFMGVGAKVADCIALFGLKKYDAFPVDVWVKRVMEEFYLKDENLSLPKMRKYSIDKFGDLGGYAQQYLFYYARDTGIGKNKK